MADIYGSNANDVLTDTTGDDTIYGLGGDDRIFAGDGDDVIYGDFTVPFSPGNIPFPFPTTLPFINYAGLDVIYSGDGNDTVYGGGGNDYIFTSVHNASSNDDDTAYGGTGNDYIDTGAGIDMLVGEDGDDTLVAGDGDDTLLGGTGNDTLLGGGDDDLLIGYLNHGETTDIDTLTGGSGADLFALGNSFGDAYLGAGEAIITDFDRSSGDEIRVYEDNIFLYELGQLANGDTEILKDGDVLAVVQDVHITYADLVSAQW